MKTIFISYSWDDEDHKEWVKTLADKLSLNGLNVLFDQYDLSIGKSLTYFMEKSLEEAEKVLLILTPKYKQKAENRRSGVGFESSLISQELYELQANNNKFLPVLRKGTYSDSAPGYIKTLLGIDLTNDETFESDFFNLLREIYEKPKVVRPAIGPEPNFDEEEIDPIIERSNKLVDKVDLQRKKSHFIDSVDGVNSAWREISKMFQEIEIKANKYKEKTKLFFNSVHNTHRCILYGEENYCVNFYWQSRCSNSLDDAVLTITIWDSPLSLRSEGSDPFYKPVQKYGVNYKFNINNEFLPQWQNDAKENFTTVELVNKYFSLLLDYIVKIKEDKLK